MESNEMKNLMLFSYIEKCGLKPSEVIEAIVRYKALKKIGIPQGPLSEEQSSFEFMETRAHELER